MEVYNGKVYGVVVSDYGLKEKKYLNSSQSSSPDGLFLFLERRTK